MSEPWGGPVVVVRFPDNANHQEIKDVASGIPVPVAFLDPGSWGSESAGLAIIDVPRGGSPGEIRTRLAAALPSTFAVFVDTRLTHGAARPWTSVRKVPDPNAHRHALNAIRACFDGAGVALGLVDQHACFGHPCFNGKATYSNPVVNCKSGQHAVGVLGLAAGAEVAVIGPTLFRGVASAVSSLHAATGDITCVQAAWMQKMIAAMPDGSVLLIPCEATVQKGWCCGQEQAPGNDVCQIPSEFVASPAYRAALQRACSKHVVVAAAGNSPVNLDALGCSTETILVGAATSSNNSPYGGYGSVVTCYGPSENMIAPGCYGGCYVPSFTTNLNSTSGAAAAIAGLCAVIQEAAPKLKFGQRLTHDQMKALLGDPSIRRDGFKVQVPDLQKILTYLNA